MHPAKAVKVIRENAEKALSASKNDCMYPLPDHFHVEICFKKHMKATNAKWYPGCRQTGVYTVEFDADDYIDVLKFIYWVL